MIKITASEIANKYSVSYQTINHYTNLGLLVPNSRKGFKRIYSEPEVGKRLKRIKELKNKGYTLMAIADLFNSRERKK